MCKRNRLFVLLCICAASAGCREAGHVSKLSFETISDSLYKPAGNYKQSLIIWKDYYVHCMNQQLFPDAFYLQLQDSINIGTINNEHELDVNKGINILDTSNGKNIFNLLAVLNSSNCSDTINLNSDLKKEFYTEVIKTINASPEYKNLAAVLEPGQMKIVLGTVVSNTLRPDSLISLLNRTVDPSLIHFKELLLEPENVLLAQTIELIGFTAEFPVNGKLNDQQKKKFEKEVYFNTEPSIGNNSIVLLPDNHLRLLINKRFTVLGQFLKLKTK